MNPTTVRDREIFDELTDEQRRAAGRIVVDILREFFKTEGDPNNRITYEAAWGYANRGNLVDRLRSAGFPLT